MISLTSTFRKYFLLRSITDVNMEMNMNMDSKWIVPIRLEGITSHHPQKLS